MKEPQYLKIHNDIVYKIEHGEYNFGSLMTPERELATSYNVNRLTIRKALKLLEEEGYITRSQGRGTFISEPKIDNAIDVMESTSNFFTDLGIASKTKAIHMQKRKAGYVYGKILNIPEDEDIYMIERLRLGNNTPLILEYTAIPYNLIPGIENYDLSIFSLYDLYTKHSIEKSKCKSTYKIVKFLESESELLNCKVGEYGFLNEEIVYDKNDKPIEYTRSYLNSKKFFFSSFMK